jgi:hypothetical protein
MAFKEICLYCKRVVREGETINGLASHVVCPECKGIIKNQMKEMEKEG